MFAKAVGAAVDYRRLSAILFARTCVHTFLPSLVENGGKTMSRRFQDKRKEKRENSPCNQIMFIKQIPATPNAMPLARR